jgi:VWFA-related protein
MRTTVKFLFAGAFGLILALSSSRLPALLAQAQPQPAPAPTGQLPEFRATTDLISTDVIVRDGRDQFVADLKQSDFEVFEDGVKQTIVSFVLSHGGRTFTQQAAPTIVRREGVFVPPSRPTSDASGRVFILFIDDLHLDFGSTPKTRDLMKRMLKNLIHDGDMFGIVTTGTSSVSQQLTYDRQVLDSAISRITGGALKAQEILSAAWSSQGPTEVRHRAHVAFETLNDLLKNLEKVQNRRKAIIYLSSGYDFNPYEKTRFEDQVEKLHTTAEQLANDPFQRQSESQLALAEGDLMGELTYLTRAANRANAAIYTIDPRGLIAGQDMADEVKTEDWLDHVRDTQTTLRIIAEETGGFAIVNQNDFDKGLKRIDSETSDYYLLGFYSSNPDPLKRSRQIKVEVVGRPELNVRYRTAYSLRPAVRAKSK